MRVNYYTNVQVNVIGPLDARLKYRNLYRYAPGEVYGMDVLHILAWVVHRSGETGQWNLSYADGSVRVNKSSLAVQLIRGAAPTAVGDSWTLYQPVFNAVVAGE